MKPSRKRVVRALAICAVGSRPEVGGSFPSEARIFLVLKLSICTDATFIFFCFPLMFKEGLILSKFLAINLPGMNNNISLMYFFARLIWSVTAQLTLIFTYRSAKLMGST